MTITHEQKLLLTAKLARHHRKSQAGLWDKEWDPLTHSEHSFDLLAAISEYGVEISMSSVGVNITVFSPMDFKEWAESYDCGQNLRDAIFQAAVAIAIEIQKEE